MQTNLEMLGGLQRRAHMSVPVDQIEAEINKRLSKLARTAKIAGFRPGKVPLKMIAQQYGPQIRMDVLNEAVNDSFVDLVNKVSAALTTDNVAAMNKAYIVDKEEAADVAKTFIEDHDLS